MTLVAFGETPLRIGTPEGRRDVTRRVDGTASTVATTASRLGTDAAWLSKLPDGPLGRRVVAELHEHGLTTDVVWAEGGRQGLTFHERGREPRKGRLLQDRTGAAAGTLTPGELPMERVQDADIVFAAGSMAALSETAAETTGALLRAASGLRAMDLDFNRDQWTPDEARETLTDCFDAVDLLFANEEQVATVLDRTGKPRETVHTLAADFDFDRVVLTRSEHGAVAYHDGVVHEQEPFETEPVDTAGQHDALIGGVLAQLDAGAAMDDALVYGVAAAALTRTMSGPLVPLEPAEVDRLVASTATRGSDTAY